MENPDFDGVQLARICRTGDKVLALLRRKLPDVLDCYILLKMLVFGFENVGLVLEPGLDADLRLLSSQILDIEFSEGRA